MSDALLPSVHGIVCGYLDTAVPLPDGWSRTVEGTALPAGRVVQFAGAPLGAPLWLYEARLQVDIWAESAREADRINTVALHALADMPGVRTGGVVSKVTIENVSYTPDDDWPEATDGAAMPRWRSDVRVVAHPVARRRR